MAAIWTSRYLQILSVEFQYLWICQFYLLIAVRGIVLSCLSHLGLFTLILNIDWKLVCYERYLYSQSSEYGNITKSVSHGILLLYPRNRVEWSFSYIYIYISIPAKQFCKVHIFLSILQMTKVSIEIVRNLTKFIKLLIVSIWIQVCLNPHAVSTPTLLPSSMKHYENNIM